MIAYKFTSPGGIGPFSGFAWPVPQDGAPGPWVEAHPETCVTGIHVCFVGDLPYWLNAELWEIELGDPVRELRKLVAGRGRLLRRIDAWDADAMAAFARWCADRTVRLANGGERLVEYAADAAGLAERAAAPR